MIFLQSLGLSPCPLHEVSSKWAPPPKKEPTKEKKLASLRGNVDSEFVLSPATFV